MQKTLSLSMVIGAVVVLASGVAQANVADIRASDRAIEFDIGAQSMKYRETVNDATFDTENGWGPSFGVGARYLTNDHMAWSALRNIYLSGDARFSQNDTDYQGGCSDGLGNTTPLSATTDNQVVNLSGKIGRAFGLGNYVMLTPFGDLGYRYWNRKLHSDSCGGYTEDYDMGTAQAGLMVQVSPWAQWVFNLTAEGGTTFDAQMRTGGVKYNLGNKPIYNFGGKVTYAVTRRFDVTGSVGMSGFGFGHSKTIVSGSTASYEPNSYTHETTAMVGVAYRLP